MPSLLVRKPDDATPVRSVTKPIVMVFDPPVLWLAPGLGALDDPDEPHAARAVQAATTRTAHAESRRRIGEPLHYRLVAAARRCPLRVCDETLPKHER